MNPAALEELPLPAMGDEAAAYEPAVIVHRSMVAEAKTDSDARINVARSISIRVNGSRINWGRSHVRRRSRSHIHRRGNGSRVDADTKTDPNRGAGRGRCHQGEEP
jgi:hypothetical protein